jgi:hypothetical protein
MTLTSRAIRAVLADIPVFLDALLIAGPLAGVRHDHAADRRSLRGLAAFTARRRVAARRDPSLRPVGSDFYGDP